MDVNVPSVNELSSISEDLRLQCSGKDIRDIQGHFVSLKNSMQRIKQMESTTTEVKYPRCEGYKPLPSENHCNGWAWRCDIKGAPTGKLAGKTIGIKDCIPVAGVPMMNGSKILEGYTPEFDATIVTRILDAGGRIIGKTNCEPLCFGASSFLCCNGLVRNPYDQTRSTGGSSSGNGALLASGLIDMAVGGDQGGSIRIPASWCGIVGLKPTHGLVPYTGAMAIEPSIDHLGPMARTVSDCALLLEVIAGYDEGRDPRQPSCMQMVEYSTKLDLGISGKKIGVLKEGFEACTEQDVADLVRREVDRLKEAGAVVKGVSIPEHSLGFDLLAVVCVWGAYKTMFNKRVGDRSFNRGREALSRGLQDKPQDLTDILKSYFVLGEYLNRSSQYKPYASTEHAVFALRNAYDRALNDLDVLIMPTTTYKASKLPTAIISLKDQLEISSSMEQNTTPFNTTGHPALSINAGFSDGLPVGMMIVGRHFDETTVLQVARAYEKMRDDKENMTLTQLIQEDTPGDSL